MAAASNPGLTDACRYTVTVCERLLKAPAGPLEPPGRPLCAALVGTPELPTVACRLGDSTPTSLVAATARTAPPSPPAMPMTTASPSTCDTIRRLRQPSALRVPNSRTRRLTPESVRRLATATAAISAAIASQVPSWSASFEALASEPLTWSARSWAVVTVAPGTVALISFLTAAICVALVALT